MKILWYLFSVGTLWFRTMNFSKFLVNARQGDNMRVGKDPKVQLSKYYPTVQVQNWSKMKLFQDWHTHHISGPND